MNRREYLVRTREFAARGDALPQTKLTGDDVRAIRAIAAERAALRERARALSNAAIAERYGVHPRTVEKIISMERIA